MEFNYDEFMHEANKEYIVHQSNQRYGQFLMNYLHEKHPEIHSQIPQDVDPFYDSGKCGQFLIFLANLNHS